jgi:hypothetical protein
MDKYTHKPHLSISEKLCLASGGRLSNVDPWLVPRILSTTWESRGLNPVCAFSTGTSAMPWPGSCRFLAMSMIDLSGMRLCPRRPSPRHDENTLGLFPMDTYHAPVPTPVVCMCVWCVWWDNLNFLVVEYHGMFDCATGKTEADVQNLLNTITVGRRPRSSKA